MREDSMEIEVGEYVRTVDGRIACLDYIETYDESHKDCWEYWFDRHVWGEEMGSEKLNGDEIKDFIVKHSKYIWELIELGDYVNGHKVEEIWENEFRFGGCDYMFQVTGDEIKSIVTKEQFASLEYKVGE